MFHRYKRGSCNLIYARNAPIPLQRVSTFNLADKVKMHNIDSLIRALEAARVTTTRVALKQRIGY